MMWFILLGPMVATCISRLYTTLASAWHFMHCSCSTLPPRIFFDLMTLFSSSCRSSPSFSSHSGRVCEFDFLKFALVNMEFSALHAVSLISCINPLITTVCITNRLWNGIPVLCVHKVNTWNGMSWCSDLFMNLLISIP